VTNVAAFGAFVDIGVHQDGLVHISALSNTYVKDPRDVVKSGDVVRVKVLEVDEARKRIGLTLRLTDEPGKPAPKQQGGGGGGGRDRRPQQRGGQQRGGQQRNSPPPASGSMADALRKAGFGK
jgi:protein Tex